MTNTVTLQIYCKEKAKLQIPNRGILTIDVEENVKITQLKEKAAEELGVNLSHALLIKSGKILRDIESLPASPTPINLILLLERIQPLQISKDEELVHNLQSNPSSDLQSIQKDLQILISSGFPERRCRKAMANHNMDVTQAFQWLLDNALNVNVDEEDESLEEELLLCVENDCCTFSFTKSKFYNQFHFECVTCSEAQQSKVDCCATCAYKCHDGHELVSSENPVYFFCICSLLPVPCLCLNQS